MRQAVSLCVTLGLGLVGLALHGCNATPRERFRERTPSEVNECFEVLMDLDETPESECGAGNFYTDDPALGCSALDVPATHVCFSPEDPTRATTVCIPGRTPSHMVCGYMLFGSSYANQGGRCTEGWLLLPGRYWFRFDSCVPEAFGRWLHERGRTVLYSDRSPYDGEPVPDPVGCPEVGEALMLCGGDCGPCPAAHDCVGRSPLHPFGVCALDGYAVPYGPPGRGAFWFVPPDGPSTAIGAEYLLLPLDACLEAEASLPGGGTCEPL